MQDFIIILLGASLLYVFATSRIDAVIKTLSLQGVLLFFLVMLNRHQIGTINLMFLIFETLVVKSVFIPWFLIRTIRRNEIRREVEPYIPQLYALTIATILFLLGFAISFWAGKTVPDIRPLYFGTAISITIASLFLIVNRKRIISHILGFMLLENGIFLLSLAVAHEMSLLVNLGILLDLFVVLFLLAVFLNKIQVLFDGDHIDVLTQLKD